MTTKPSGQDRMGNIFPWATFMAALYYLRYASSFCKVYMAAASSKES